MSRKKQKESSPRKKRKPKARKTTSRAFPSAAEPMLKEAMQYHESGQLDEAQGIYLRILEKDRNHAKALFLLGLTFHQAGENELAVDLFKRAILNDRRKPAYHNALGNALLDQGKPEEALLCYRKSLRLAPGFAEAHYNMGNVFSDRKDFDGAVSSYEKALKLKPAYFEAYYNLGKVFEDQGNLDKAKSCYEKARTLKPDFGDSCLKTGIELLHEGRSADAFCFFQDAVRFKPESAEAYNSMGCALQLCGQDRLHEAISCFKKAIALKPDFAEAHSNMGNALLDGGRSDEAIMYYRTALEIDPGLDELYSRLVHELKRTCAWQEVESLEPKLDDLTTKALEKGCVAPEPAFVCLARDTDLARNLAVARSWSKNIEKDVSQLKTDFSIDLRDTPNKKIVIGYLSGDFRDHPIGHLTAGMFRLHNRDKYKVVCYSYGKDDYSDYRRRIERDCDVFVDFRATAHVDAARRIYKDSVNILVDLTGYTKGSRVEICALRPAPVQVSYLGFLGTTGADFYDYIISDRMVTPESHAPYYTESFVCLPHCYQVNDNGQAISGKNYERGDFGLTDGSFVFCSFNNPYKIDPELFDSWLSLLRRVPGSLLWLIGGNASVEGNLTREAERRGVNYHRLVFAKPLPLDEHLGRLRLADLALDTRIYNGGATTSNALWSGVPVVTLQGNRFVSRMSSSMLSAVGLPELITHSLEEYESFAVELAQDTGRHGAVCRKLAQNRMTEPLFDTPRFVKNLEEAYRKMWGIFLAREKPRQIQVVES